jgi:hypothetical protein
MKGLAMLIVLVPAALAVAALGCALWLYRIWREVPRSNADFEVF